MPQDRILTGLRLPQVRLIAGYWVKFSLRTGGGLIALLAILLVGFIIAAITISPAEELMRASPELGHAEDETAAFIQELSESEGAVRTVQWVTGADQAQADFLLRENPALLSVMFLVFLWFVPYIACLVGFNQTAGDIGNRGLRYVLLRTERPNVLLGRFLGTVFFALIATTFLYGFIVFYVGVKFAIYPAGDLLLWGLQCLLAGILFSLPYLALCAWLSSLLTGAFAALAICFMAAGVPIVFMKIADGLTPQVDLAWLERLLPWGWKYDLMSHDPGTRLLAYGVMLAFTLVFLALAFRSFQKRDL